MIQIISLREGSEAREIREKWVGLTMPAEPEFIVGPVRDLLGGWLVTRINKEHPLQEGDYGQVFVVSWQDAMDALGRKYPETRKFYEQSAAGAGQPDLLFPYYNCKEV